MPPRRNASKATATASANKSETKGLSSRQTRSYGRKKKNSSPPSATLFCDELNTQNEPSSLCTCRTQTSNDEDEILDEILVVGPRESASQLTNAETEHESMNLPSTLSAGNISPKPPMEHIRPDSSNGRVLFIPTKESTPTTNKSSPVRRGTPIKKQDFEVAVSAVSGADDTDELAAEEPPPPKKLKLVAKKTTQLGTFNKMRSSKWDNPDEMLTNPKSPLVRAKLRDLLCSPKAWDVLTVEEKQQILAKFPDEAEILDAGTPNARPDVAALRNNNNFRHDVTRYQDGLGRGYHDPEWIRQAQEAHRNRQEGFYNDLLATEFEEKWGIPMPGRQTRETEAPVKNDNEEGNSSCA